MPSGQALVEREEQHARLAGLLADVERGAGALALVTGEAGIGKTSLVRGFCAGLPSGVRVLRGGCDPVEAPRPLGPLHEVGLQVGGQLAVVLAGDEARLHRFRALQETLATGPLTVLVVEDVHWADDATLDLLTFLGRRADSLRALVVLTSRDRAGHVRADRVIGDLVSLPTVHRIEVPALTVAGLRALGEVEDAELLHRRTGGNPFFVTEVLASGRAGMPTNVRDAVLSRTADLSAGAREVVELVSVVPDRADLELVRAATAAEPGSLDECQAAGLLVPTPRGLGFRHEIAREAVESSLTAARSAELHATVLRELSRRPGSPDAVLSHHADLAGEGAAVLRHAPRAAIQASRLGAHRESVIHLDRALRYADRLDLPGHAALLGARAAELEALGDATAA
ncbi:MAG: helix-turn-helix transcriptional regulator, partial [Nocardioidaceae bacterium]|nr:helix-turn-helix transcriptional regulator [Nocardioidaceae bacterium]